MSRLPFANREQAGDALAEALSDYRGRDDVLVMGLPRGGVPVAARVAAGLGAPLDLMVVRKLGTPGQEELAMGAIASGGGQVLNEDVVRDLAIGQETIDRVAERERRELARREEAYRGARSSPDLRNRCVILVDDGIATGATMRAAVGAVRAVDAREVVVAVPVAPPETAWTLEREADRIVCLETPEPFMGVGRWYRDFGQTSDDEVVGLLQEAWRKEDAAQSQRRPDMP